MLDTPIVVCFSALGLKPRRWHFDTRIGVMARAAILGWYEEYEVRVYRCCCSVWHRLTLFAERSAPMHPLPLRCTAHCAPKFPALLLNFPVIPPASHIHRLAYRSNSADRFQNAGILRLEPDMKKAKSGWHVKCAF